MSVFQSFAKICPNFGERFKSHSGSTGRNHRTHMERIITLDKFSQNKVGEEQRDATREPETGQTGQTC